MQYFTYEEFIHSNLAIRHHIDNTPDTAVTHNIQRLVETILDPLRESIGHPLTISSGYRCSALNTIAGGARTSAHMFGRAVDVVPGKSTVTQLIKEIISLKLPFDQLIDEFGGAWLHIGIAEDGLKPRGQILKAVRLNGQVQYKPYL
jgi:zinc D-Ala-D-Ala carboxypeptidase